MYICTHAHSSTSKWYGLIWHQLTSEWPQFNQRLWHEGLTLCKSSHPSKPHDYIHTTTSIQTRPSYQANSNHTITSTQTTLPNPHQHIHPPNLHHHIHTCPNHTTTSTQTHHHIHSNHTITSPKPHPLKPHLPNHTPHHHIHSNHTVTSKWERPDLHFQ